MISFLLAALALQSTGVDPACNGGTVRVGDYGLHTELKGEGDITVLFESGNGNDSTVWEELAPQIRAEGVRTLRYDRAGLGQSDPRPGEGYDVDREVDAMQALLNACGVSGPVLLVAHSYGGATGLLLAERDERISAALLLDAIVPQAMSQEWADYILGAYRPRFEGVRKAAPAMANHIIPLMEAFPQTSNRLASMQLPERLVIHSLVSGKGGETPEWQENWVEAQRAFAAEAPNKRKMGYDPSSGHHVEKERPAWVMQSASYLIGWIRLQQSLAGK